MPFVIAPLVIFAAVVLFLLPVLVRLFRHCRPDEITPEWLSSFSPANYKPMELLLDDVDFEFLVRQPGFDASIGKKLRRDRIRIFRQYLNRMIGDFNRLDTYARFLISKSQEDQSALFLRLIGIRARFSLNVVRLQFSLALAYFGSEPRTVSQVIAQLEEMSSWLSGLSAA